MSLNDSEISSETTMSETLPETLSTSSETSLNNIESEILEVSSDDIEKKLASAIADGVFLNRFHNMKELKKKMLEHQTNRMELQIKKQLAVLKHQNSLQILKATRPSPKPAQ